MSLFFSTFLATIIVTRIFLYARPTASPTIFSVRLHHWMYGVVCITIGYVFTLPMLTAIGLGLFVDELTFILMRGTTHEDNYSLASLFGTAIFVVLVFCFDQHVQNILL